MPVFGKVSKKNLETCHIDIVSVASTAIQLIDFKVTSGYRGQKEQDFLYEQGLSTKKYPFSNHNSIPSRAFDIAPWPIDWKDLKRFHVLAGIILGIGYSKGIGLIWGGDWDGDFTYRDQFFHDLGHFELIGE